MRQACLWFSLVLAACGDGGASTPGMKDAGASEDTAAAAPAEDVAPLPEDVAEPPDASEDAPASPEDVPEDVPPEDVAPPPEDVAPPPEDAWEVEAAKINLGFIGGACAAVADCDYAEADCLTEGFPDGLCSKACDLYCPDQDGAIGTFCINGKDAGHPELDGICTTRCHYGVTPTGCRPGYQCVPLPRHTQDATIVYTCIPGTGQAYQLTECDQQLLALGVGFTPVPNPKDSPDGFPNLVCDLKNPLRIDPIIHGVAFREPTLASKPAPLFVNCALALSLEKTAAAVAQQGVTDIVHLGTYNCRVIAGTSTLSEHGLANAIDVSALKKADASDAYVVELDWEKDTAIPVTDAGSFLEWFVETLFEDKLFNIILTPDYNAAHYNHFHMDLTPGSGFMK